MLLLLLKLIHSDYIKYFPPLVGGDEGGGDKYFFTPTLTFPHQGGGNLSRTALFS